MDEVQLHLRIKSDVSKASRDAQFNIDRGLVPSELIGQYVRKAIGICTDCGVMGHSNNKDSRSNGIASEIHH